VVRILKKSWYVPAATARRNSFFRLIKLSDTMVLVIVVPMLAPMMMGMALCKVIDPDATNATTNEVVVELLCNMAVMSNPMNRPVNGFDVASKIVSATFFPMCCSDDVIRSRANKNNTKAPAIASTMRTLLQALRFAFRFDSVCGTGSNFFNVR